MVFGAAAIENNAQEFRPEFKFARIRGKGERAARFGCSDGEMKQEPGRSSR
jgi:hypothetical protein